MFILKTFLEAFGQILHMALNIYIWVVIIQALLSWVRPDPYNPIVQILNKLTIPTYNFVRRKVRTVFSGVDLAPLIIVLALQFLDIFLVKTINHFAAAI
jgi:YggT family protein